MDRKYSYQAIVVGGGFFGCSLALHLRRQLGLEVAILECGSGLMQRASHVNQARVHNGYHYPRSILTGLRSRLNFERFVDEYRDSICDRFEAYYGVARRFSKVGAAQFQLFCQRIGAPLSRAPGEIRQLFNPDLIEDVFRVREFVFDAEKLRARIWDELREAGVEVHLRTEARSLSNLPSGAGIAVACQSGNGEAGDGESDGGKTVFQGRSVYNCTYARTNRLLVASGRPAIPLKHELTELALIETPDLLRGMAVTVMCGPFFSIMPFPPRGVHSLSHVRYTPHGEWRDAPSGLYQDPYEILDVARRRSNVTHMLRDAARYLPCLAESRYLDSIWETKTVLPLSEGDDSRPILFVRDKEIHGLTCVMGGKLDNIYDMIDHEIADRRGAA